MIKDLLKLPEYQRKELAIILMESTLNQFERCLSQDTKIQKLEATLSLQKVKEEYEKDSI